MSTRRRSSLRLATVVAALGAVAAMGGCSTPPSGVHVVVTMSDAGYDAQHAFDHLTVTAHVGARRAVGCLYPADAVDRAVALDEEPGLTAWACADRRTQPWTGPPTATGWALETQPPSINVEAEEGEDVEVVMTGGLGGRLGTVRGKGAIRASSAFPELRIELTAGEWQLPECDAKLKPSFPEELGIRFGPLCEAEKKYCPGKWPSMDPLRSPAVFCIDPGGSRVSRVLNGDGVTCPNGGQEEAQIVWNANGPPTQSDCVRVFATGRFVRCVEGDAHDPGGCAVTTDCTPPRTWVGVRAQGAAAYPDGSPDIACLPPTSVPITWSVDLKRPAGPVVFGLAQDVMADDPRSCFLDVYDVATTLDCSP